MNGYKTSKTEKMVLNASDKFNQIREALSVPDDALQSRLERLDLTQLGELVGRLLKDESLEVSKVRPFFWSLVEAYVDRFQLYPLTDNEF